MDEKNQRNYHEKLTVRLGTLLLNPAHADMRLLLSRLELIKGNRICL